MLRLFRQRERRARLWKSQFYLAFPSKEHKSFTNFRDFIVICFEIFHSMYLSHTTSNLTATTYMLHDYYCGLCRVRAFCSSVTLEVMVVVLERGERDGSRGRTG